MEVITETIIFLTDPDGIGFPILIGSGLGIILYLMHVTKKEEKQADKEIDEHKDQYQGPSLPYKPF